jgi:hypothetical protein
MVDWERNWRSNGIVAALLFLVSFVVYGSQPKIGSSAVKLVSFYDGDSTRILISAVLFGFPPPNSQPELRPRRSS